MTKEAWKIDSASVRGISHEMDDSECQDFHRCLEIDGTLICLASDGAGSSSQSLQGAETICNGLCDYIGSFIIRQGDLEGFTSELLESWIDEIRSDLLTSSGAENLNEYRATLLGAIVSQNKGVFFQIGDGAISFLEKKSSQFELAFWPEESAFVNATFFFTEEDYANHLQFKKINSGIEQVLAFTDGLERIAIDFVGKKPHDPLLRGLIKKAQKHSAEESDGNLSEAFLNSSRLDTATADDKTLILAWRIGETE